MVKIKKSFILIIIASFVFALMSGGNLPYSILYCFLCLFLVAIFYSMIIRRNLSVSLKIEKGLMYTKEENEVELKIYNDTIFPISYLEIQNDIFNKSSNKYRGDIVSIGINSNKFIKRKIKFPVRGIYTQEASNCTFGDLFGIVKWTKTYKHRGVIRVYPSIYKINKIKINGSNIKKSNAINNTLYNNLSENNETIKNIREYRFGDNYRRINWKVSAKHGKLFIKEYENSESPRVQLFLDFRNEPLSFDSTGEAEEELVDFFLSLINHLIASNLKLNATLICSEKINFNFTYEGDMEVINEYIINHYSCGGGLIEKYMEKEIGDVDKNSSVIIVTCDLSKTNLDYFSGLAAKGYNVTLFYLNKGIGVKDEIINTAVNNGVLCYNIEEIR